MRAVAYLMAGYMLIGSFFPGSDFSQLSRMPTLLDHFYQHRDLASQNGSELSVLDFLRIHFLQTNQHGDAPGQHDHHELPLQSLTVHLEIVCSTQLLPESIPPVFQNKADFAYIAPRGHLYHSIPLLPPIT